VWLGLWTRRYIIITATTANMSITYIWTSPISWIPGSATKTLTPTTLASARSPRGSAARY
jgi:hypothetical protein